MTPTLPFVSTRRPQGFANGALIGVDDARRADTEAFIAQVYRARYGAELTRFLPHLLAFRNAVKQAADVAASDITGELEENLQRLAAEKEKVTEHD